MLYAETEFIFKSMGESLFHTYSIPEEKLVKDFIKELAHDVKVLGADRVTILNLTDVEPASVNNGF